MNHKGGSYGLIFVVITFILVMFVVAVVIFGSLTSTSVSQQTTDGNEERLKALWENLPIAREERMPKDSLFTSVINFDKKKLESVLPASMKTFAMYNPSFMYRPEQKEYVALIRASNWTLCKVFHLLKNNNPHSYVYRFVFSEDWKIKDWKLVDLDYENLNNCKAVASGPEDPRIFMYTDEEYGIANIFGSAKQYEPCINQMALWKRTDPVNTFKFLNPPPGVAPTQRQKNWAPFQYNDLLLCEYSIYPHRILQLDPHTGNVRDYATSGDKDDVTKEDSVRPSASAILVPWDNRVVYLSVAHSHTLDKSYWHYFYIFDPSPPFAIIAISERLKMPYSEHVQFVSGVYYDPEKDEIGVSYGVKDCTCRIARTPLSNIKKLLMA